MRGDAVFEGGYELPSGGGVFAGWQWDGRELHARVDRYGCFPLFYFEGDGEVALSTSVVRLLAAGAPAVLDEAALAAFVRLGFFLGEDTPFSAIRAMPPAGRLSWDGSRASVSGRFAVAAPQRISRADAIDGLNDLFAQAMDRRRSPGRVVLPLSGGRDSRHILLALVHAGRPPDECVTVEPLPPRVSESAQAAKLAVAAGVPHRVLRQRGSRVALERRKNVRTHFCSDEHAQFLALAAYLHAHAGVAYDGLGGDMLTGQSSSIDPAMISLFEEGRLGAAAEMAFEGYGKHGIESALRRLLAPRVYAALSRERAIERVTREMARHQPSANPTLAFFFWNRTRRELALAPYALMSGVRVYSPYLDHQLFDFLTSLPAAAVIDHQLHTEAIARAYPRFSHIPFNQGESSAAAAAPIRRDAVSLAAYIATHPRAVRVRYVVPRLALALVTARPSALWFLPLAVYFAQLLSEEWQ